MLLQEQDTLYFDFKLRNIHYVYNAFCIHLHMYRDSNMYCVYVCMCVVWTLTQCLDLLNVYMHAWVRCVHLHMYPCLYVFVYLCV